VVLRQRLAIPEVVIQFGNDFGRGGNYTKTPFILHVDKPLRNRLQHRSSEQVVYASVGYRADSLVWQVSRVAHASPRNNPIALTRISVTPELWKFRTRDRQ